MGKSSNFIGQPLFNQLIKLISRQKIQEIAQKGGYNRYVKRFDGYSHLVTLLFAVFSRYDSLREIVLGLMSEANKLSHLGLLQLVSRSTLSDANNRRSHVFFEKIYTSLYERYGGVLSDSQVVRKWEKALYIIDSTTITLFSNILKGAGRHPKHGKKKGGIKCHTVLKAIEQVPCLVRFTAAAVHDHFMLKILNLPMGSFVAMDRAYIDYKYMQLMTEKCITYVTKMKSNLKYRLISSVCRVQPRGLVEVIISTVEFEKGDMRHKARMIEYWREGCKCSQTLLTNNFELDYEEIIEIYERRWQIELLFKQLKQNFQLRYFYGESVNAIKTQIWTTLIANLLLTLVKRRVKRKWSFSGLATVIRQTLMHYINMWAFLEEPEKTWVEINQLYKHKPPELQLSIF
jgi:IS4 transposase